MAPIVLLLLLLAPAAVEGFAARILRPPSSHSHSRHSSVCRRTRGAAGLPTTVSPTTPSSTTRLAASQRASSEGFGDARGRSAFMDQGRMELLCKAGPDGASLGDCPFCHYVQMVLRYKVSACACVWICVVGWLVRLYVPHVYVHVCVHMYNTHGPTRSNNIPQGLKYRLVPLTPEDKPEWLLEGYGGKMPCLVHDEEVGVVSCMPWAWCCDSTMV